VADHRIGHRDTLRCFVFPIGIVVDDLVEEIEARIVIRSINRHPRGSKAKDATGGHSG
jgi:hypothetical protein